MTKKPLAGEQDKQWQKAMDRANALYKKGKYDEARECFQEAMDLAEGFGPHDPRLATTLNNMGLVHYAQKRYAEAEPLYRRAISIREKSLGSEHPLVAMSLSNLALLYYAQKKFSKAAPICEQALEIREKALEPDHLDLAHSLSNLALIYHALKDHDKAELLCQRALSIRQNQLAADHPLVVSAMKTLAKIYKSLGKKDEAKSLTQQANSLEKKTSRKSSSTTVTAETVPVLEEKISEAHTQSTPVKAEVSVNTAESVVQEKFSSRSEMQAGYISRPRLHHVRFARFQPQFRKLGFYYLPQQSAGNGASRLKRVWGWPRRRQFSPHLQD